ncbi:TPA: TIGR03751 family conjugal transfer lipoprotein, partial [Escherichia coli]|nr:TIGR03751 family conjugal transfer lipoprotein [Escherichia coli]
MMKLLLPLLVLTGTVLAGGCSTSKEELLPAGEQTMLEIWQGQSGGGSARSAA